MDFIQLLPFPFINSFHTSCGVKAFDHRKKLDICISDGLFTLPPKYILASV